MQNILDKIVAYKKEELSSLKRRVSLKDVQHKANDAAPTLPFLSNLKEDAIAIIAEIKKASPSKGVICGNFNPYDLAHIYEDNGAVGLSVLTDAKFFQGSLDYLTGIKKRVKIPCLRKDFTLSEYHVYEARGAGADAILLIAAILDEPQLKGFQALATELGMMSLVEVHDEKELGRACVGAIHRIKSGPSLWGELPLQTIIGVNNRNLKTFDVNLKTSYDLIEKIPESIVCVSESGLESHEDLVGLQEAGFDAFLIGEALLREKDVGGKLKEFLKG